MSISQSISQSVCQPVSHQPGGQSIIQPVSLSVNDFGQKLQISFSFVLGKKIGLEVVFDDYLVRKEVVLDYKNIDFNIDLEFLKGVNP